MVFDKYQLKKLGVLNLSKLGISQSTRSAISRCRSKRGRSTITEAETVELMKALHKVEDLILSIRQEHQVNTIATGEIEGAAT